MKLILIRHGKTEANEKRLYCGSTDVPLCEAGRAELSARRREGRLPDAGGCRIITSPLVRCTETLYILYGVRDAETDADLKEMDLGAFEMHSYEELKDDPAYQAWIAGDNEANITPGGESGQMLCARALRALSRILADGRDTLAVTHGGVIAAIMAHLFPEEKKNRYEWQPDGGGGYVIDTEQKIFQRF